MTCSRHDNLPCSPSDPSRNDVLKVEGVSTFSLGVLVWGHDIHKINKQYIYKRVSVSVESTALN